MGCVQRLALCVMLVASVTFSSNARGELGEKMVGTYLAVSGEKAEILQISRDGNVRGIFSTQFRGGVLDLPFSDSWGSWEQSGDHQMTAKMVNLSFERGTGKFVGVAGATYAIKFDEKSEQATVTCKGAVFPPGVNPFDKDAQPVAGGSFDCGTLVFRRIR